MGRKRFCSSIGRWYEAREVLHSVSLTFREGTVNALVGPSGSGKSTIANRIASFWDVDSGSITVGGAGIRNISAEHYNQLSAYVSQDNFLFDNTVRENIRNGQAQCDRCRGGASGTRLRLL